MALSEFEEHYDDLETRTPEERAEAMFGALPHQIHFAQFNSPAFKRILEGVDSDSVDNPEALAKLPITRKSELMELQNEDPPFGGLVTVKTGELARVFASPGPIYEPEGRAGDYWRMARALHAGHFRRNEVVHNAFSYHLTPAGSMMESAAHTIGCAVVPAGVGQTELQVETMGQVRPTAYTGTPSFLKILLDKAEEMKRDVSSLTKAVVSGEALPPSLRQEFADRGIHVSQCYATADLGLIAYESHAREGLIIDETIIVELVQPGTGDPVEPGEVGEVVVTTLGDEYPLIRFATGDLSAELPGPSPCGRTAMRLKGWMGRADETTKIRGMFVHPAQVNDVLKRHPEIAKGRLVVTNPDNQDAMTLRCEVDGGGSSELADAVVNSLRDVAKLRGEVEFVAKDELPADGKTIEDLRTYE